jgi:hypothetical protein
MFCRLFRDGTLARAYHIPVDRGARGRSRRKMKLSTLAARLAGGRKLIPSLTAGRRAQQSLHPLKV